MDQEIWATFAHVFLGCTWNFEKHYNNQKQEDWSANIRFMVCPDFLRFLMRTEMLLGPWPLAFPKGADYAACQCGCGPRRGWRMAAVNTGKGQEWIGKPLRTFWFSAWFKLICRFSWRTPFLSFDIRFGNYWEWFLVAKDGSSFLRFRNGYLGDFLGTENAVWPQSAVLA